MEKIEILIAGLVMLVGGLALLAKLTKSDKDDRFFNKASSFLKKLKSLFKQEKK